MSWPDFFASQLFGVIVGALMTGGFTGLLEFLKTKGEHRRHIREKREELYIKACEVLMEHEKHCREFKWPQSCKYMFNKLQGAMMIYASKPIYDEYYKLDREICQAYAKIHSEKQIEAKSNELADKIEAFATNMRNELGIKGAL